jgi:hypothetical protein
MIAFQADPSPRVRWTGDDPVEDAFAVRPAIDIVAKEDDGPFRRISLDPIDHPVQRIDTAVDITYGERVAHVSFLAPVGGQVKSGSPRQISILPTENPTHFPALTAIASPLA